MRQVEDDDDEEEDEEDCHNNKCKQIPNAKQIKNNVNK
jgi:hypothetical protein